MVSSGNTNSGSGISSGRQIVTPLGLSILQAIFASRRLAAKPIEHVICSPIFARILSLIFFASPSGSAMFARSSLQASSSMDFTVSIGISQAISLSSALCARRNRSGRCVTRMMSGQMARASGTGMTFLQPAALASFEQAMTTVEFAADVSKGITPTGRPRRCGIACCMTEAKKPSKSR